MTKRTDGVLQACELFEVGVRMVEQRFRRDHPHATDADVADRVAAWMLDRAVAPAGDYAHPLSGDSTTA